MPAAATIAKTRGVVMLTVSLAGVGIAFSLAQGGDRRPLGLVGDDQPVAVELPECIDEPRGMYG